jgi:hypothetical protein
MYSMLVLTVLSAIKLYTVISVNQTLIAKKNYIHEMHNIHVVTSCGRASPGLGIPTKMACHSSNIHKWADPSSGRLSNDVTSYAVLLLLLLEDLLLDVRNGQEIKRFLDFLTLKMGPISCLKTSVKDYHYSLPNNPEQRSSHLLRGGRLTTSVVIS